MASARERERLIISPSGELVVLLLVLLLVVVVVFVIISSGSSIFNIVIGYFVAHWLVWWRRVATGGDVRRAQPKTPVDWSEPGFVVVVIN